MAIYTANQFPLAEETKLIIGLGFAVHNQLGKGFLEIVYKDAMEWELRRMNISFEREKSYTIEYKNTLLPHKFFADFVVFESIILEIKAKEGIAEEHLAQTINYLKVSGCKLGLILNFGESSLKIKRLIL